MRNVDRIEVAHMFTGLGVSLRTVFPDPESNLQAYRNHRWMVVQNHCYHIIHAVPTEDALEGSFWEEWYSHNDGPVIHHILFPNEPKVLYHDIYVPPKRQDGLHPPEIFGRTWYLMEEPSLLAWGVQELLRLD